ASGRPASLPEHRRQGWGEFGRVVLHPGNFAVVVHLSESFRGQVRGVRRFETDRQTKRLLGVRRGPEELDRLITHEFGKMGSRPAFGPGICPDLIPVEATVQGKVTALTRKTNPIDERRL